MSNRDFSFTAKQKWETVQLVDKGLRYIIHDLELLRSDPKLLPMSFPQILLVFSGIEFLSAILYSKGNYSTRVARYISEWMPEEYGSEAGSNSIGGFLYDGLRSGLVHYGNVKGDIVVDHDAKAVGFHMRWFTYKGKERLFIHGNHFALHFLESVQKVKEGIRRNAIDLEKVAENAEKLAKKLENSKRNRPPQKKSFTDLTPAVCKESNAPISLPRSTAGTTFTGEF